MIFRKIQGRSVLTSELIEITISDGKVTGLEIMEDDGDFPWISPGFFDIQVNGFKGKNYSSENLAGTDLLEISSMLKKSGTTRHLPTIITGPVRRITANLKTLAKVLDKNRELEYSVPGFHMEGPYISKEDGPRGAHDVGYARIPDYEEYLSWQEASGGRIRIVTLAPELPGALDFIEKITRDGVVAAIGHTGALPEVIREAVEAGARLSTHLGNGSHAELPRLKNYLWEQLSRDSLFASVIADGFHLPYSVMKTFYRTKGMERLILASDVSPFGGLAPGSYTWDRIGVEVYPDGHVGLGETPFLAGAGHLLDHDIPRFAMASGCSLEEAVKMCTVNPLMLVMGDRDTCLSKVGLRGDITVFRVDEESGDLVIEDVIC